MSYYYNFNEESKAHEFWKKICTLLENKNVVNWVSVFRKIVRLRYQDGPSMAEHMNAFQGLINQTTSLEVPLANQVLALLLLGSLSDSWETLVVTLGNAESEGKHLSMSRVKSSLMNEEARWKDRESKTNEKAFVIEGDTNWGRDRNRNPQNWNKSGTRLKSRGRPKGFCCGKRGHF